jgi:hypothetical protein
MKRGPGIGKIYKLATQYPNVKFEVSTVNTQPLKSLQLETRFWYEKTSEKNTKVQLDTLFRECKKTLWFKSEGIYDIDKIISIKEIPFDLESKTEKVFAIFEFTLFPTKKFNNDIEISMEMSKIVDNLYQDVFEGREDLTRSKK